ncbi:MAG: hypothetical protein PHN37_02675 [Candidatus Pacebacteria bacterium]|nr:hypothetical protein [Candidatus Paceibacterota bacterium]
MKKITLKHIIFLLALVIIINLTGFLIYNISKNLVSEEQEKTIIQNPFNLKAYMLDAYPDYLEGVIVFSNNQAYLKTKNTTYELRPSDFLFYEKKEIKNNQKIKVQGKIENNNRFAVGIIE